MARRPGRRRGIWAIALLVLGVMLIAGPLAYMRVRFTPVKQFGDNMLPTIPVGSLLLMEKDHGEVRRGDVVTYDPAEWGYDGPFVGRVVALGGDHIAYTMGDRTLALNGKPLDEPYVPDGEAGAGGVGFAVSVPQGRMFVLGDNRGNSQDSRFHPEHHRGTLPLAAVTGVDSGMHEESPLMVVLGLPLSAGICLLPLSLGLGIASLVVRRRRPAESPGPVWGATQVDVP
ncbi:signal peptidase I [Streptomyces sp. NPDC058874]|uniref:signal peptidase I n=1 Tax=unclassified Streptomyces TaxID=2593676 RepID=UPI0036C2A6C9